MPAFPPNPRHSSRHPHSLCGRKAYLEYVLYGGEDEVLPSQRVHHILVGYGLGRDAALFDELGAAPDEGHELVVVETPDALAAGRLHPVALLQPLGQPQVAAAARRRVSGLGRRSRGGRAHAGRWSRSPGLAVTNNRG